MNPVSNNIHIISHTINTYASCHIITNIFLKMSRNPVKIQGKASPAKIYEK